MTECAKPCSRKAKLKRVAPVAKHIFNKNVNMDITDTSFELK